MRAITRYAALVGLLACSGSACEERPARPGPPDLSSSPQSIEIRGSTTLSRPGDVSQLTAFLVYANGMKEDATSRGANFSIPWDDSVASVTTSGRLVARGYGRTTVTVTCMHKVATAQVTVLPDGMFLLTGRVTQEGQYQLPLDKATVQATTSGQVFSTVTDYDGHYAVPAAGDTTVRVEAYAFYAQSLPIVVTRDAQLDVIMRATDTQFGGAYVLTFTASPSCSLPAIARTRKYTATVEDSSGSLIVFLSDPFWSDMGFRGSKDGKTVSFKIVGSGTLGPLFAETLENGQIMRLDGDASGTIAAGTLLAIFSGTVRIFASATTIVAECSANDHVLNFAR
jgi:hypothetical protein